MTNIDTKERFETSQPDDARREHDALPATWAETVEMYREQLVSPVFLSSLGNIHEMTEQYDVDQTIATGIERWTVDNREVFGDTLSTRLILMAQSPMAVHHSTDIQHYSKKRKSSEGLNKDERNHLKQAKLAAVEYNQLLNNYMYANPDDSYNDLKMGLIMPTLDAFPSHENMAEQTLTNTIKGARFESITRQALDELNIPYRLPTAEEDLHGADIFLMDRGVDLKSSLDQVVSSKDGYSDSLDIVCRVEPPFRPGQEPRILFWPGISEKSLGDSLAWQGDSSVVMECLVKLQLAMMKLPKS